MVVCSLYIYWCIKQFVVDMLKGLSATYACPDVYEFISFQF